ncbi:recombinase family protein [Planobispora rosea]|uniref:recombinase family protein n=1 Tax=Planobispora rosea TaxID=35762 RepID=UPI000ACB8140|nr:recombinase family protein [Planobispora rosea]
MNVPAVPAAMPVEASPASPANAIRIGYARVSTRAQDHQLQMDALAGAHCREIVEETGSIRRERPKLAATIERMQAGDTLVIYKPDRVARSVKELLVFLEDELAPRGINLQILSGVCAGLHRPGGQSVADKMLFMVAAMAAEMERDLIRERTNDGLAAAAAQGRRGGRPPAIDADKLAAARARRSRGETIPAIAKAIGVGRSTLYRALEDDPAPVAAVPGVGRAVDREQELSAPMLSPALDDGRDAVEAVASAPAGRDQEQEPSAPSIWQRYGDPMRRRTWYTEAQMTGARYEPTGDGGHWVIVGGDVLGLVEPHLTARGTRSGWQARRRPGGAALASVRRRPATRAQATDVLLADVHASWSEQRRLQRLQASPQASSRGQGRH